MNHVVKKLEDRFWEKVDKSGNCWIWKSAKNFSGYGIFQLPNPKKSVVSHRIAWFLTKGEIPKGKLVLHKCDIRDCVRPSHLFIGTPQDNSSDMVRKKRQAYGVFHGRNILTEKQVKEIKHRYKKRSSENNQYTLAKEFGVNQGTIFHIVNKKTWRHL